MIVYICDTNWGCRVSRPLSDYGPNAIFVGTNKGVPIIANTHLNGSWGIRPAEKYEDRPPTKMDVFLVEGNVPTKIGTQEIPARILPQRAQRQKEQLARNRAALLQGIAGVGGNKPISLAEFNKKFSSQESAVKTPAPVVQPMTIPPPPPLPAYKRPSQAGPACDKQANIPNIVLPTAPAPRRTVVRFQVPGFGPHTVEYDKVSLSEDAEALLLGVAADRKGALPEYSEDVRTLYIDDFGRWFQCLDTSIRWNLDGCVIALFTIDDGAQ